MNAAEMGRRGGRSRSAAKRAAARRNGERGGRPPLTFGVAGLGLWVIAWLILRGYNSLHATNQPLIVVDGMPYDITDYGRSQIGNHHSNALAQIDVRDIENITVVKDGLSTYFLSPDKHKSTIRL